MHDIFGDTHGDGAGYGDGEFPNLNGGGNGLSRQPRHNRKPNAVAHHIHRCTVFCDLVGGHQGTINPLKIIV